MCARARAPWNNEDAQQKDMIRPELYNDLLDDADNEINLNAWKTIDARDFYWW